MSKEEKHLLDLTTASDYVYLNQVIKYLKNKKLENKLIIIELFF
jgi:hypothetical protein